MFVMHPLFMMQTEVILTGVECAQTNVRLERFYSAFRQSSDQVFKMTTMDEAVANDEEHLEEVELGNAHYPASFEIEFEIRHFRQRETWQGPNPQSQEDKG